MNNKSRIYIAGHTGMVGSALQKRMLLDGFKNITTMTRNKLNLLDQKKTRDFIEEVKPEIVILLAGKVGGILANTKYPADFIYENLTIQNNIIYSSLEMNVKTLIFLGSSCIYPRNCQQPMKENMLLSGKLEKSNASYSIAKIAGVNLCDSISKQHGLNYFSLMPSNLYGPNDNFDSNLNHVIPSLISKFHTAKINDEKIVKVWGSGNIKREFLFIDDLVDGILHILNKDYKLLDHIFSQIGSRILNIGFGYDLTIKELAKKIAEMTEYNHEIIFDRSMPDGVSQKLLDTTYINSLGWEPKTNLDDGLKLTYEWYKNIYKI